jgi:hypothetical protein
MKSLRATTAAGETVVFWLKQGWSDTTAILTNPRAVPDERFSRYVADRVASAKRC